MREENTEERERQGMREGEGEGIKSNFPFLNLYKGTFTKNPNIKPTPSPSAGPKDMAPSFWVKYFQVTYLFPLKNSIKLHTVDF